ncbi:hypothetical protein BH10PLA1_BH10PLA1_14450 [soil metagenome]
MGGAIIFLAVPLGIILFVWGVFIFYRSSVPVGSVEVRGNGARFIGVATMLVGICTVAAPFTMFGRHDMGMGQLAAVLAAHLPAALGIVLAMAGMVFAGVGIRERQWQAMTWGAILFLIGVVLVLQLNAVGQLIFQLIGRKPD